MPRWKYVSNRFLTTVENVAFGLHLSEYHTGLRAYSRRLLETIPYGLNSDDFVFDQELIAQVVAAGMGCRIGEIAVPTRYFEEASSVGFKRSVVYGLSTLRVVARYVLHRSRLRRLAQADLAPRPRGLTGTVVRRDPRRPDPAPGSGSRSRSPRWATSCRGVDLARTADILRTGRPRWIALSVVLQVDSTCASGRRAGSSSLRPDRDGPLPADARLSPRRLPRQQHPAGPTRRARPEPLPRRPRGDQPDVGARDGRRRAGRRHGGRGHDRRRRRRRPPASAASWPARCSSGRRSSGCSSSPSPSGSSPIACPARTGSVAFAER